MDIVSRIPFFECLLDAAQYKLLKAELSAMIDKEHDSLRFYELGNHYQAKVDHVGAKPGYDPEGILIL